MTVGRTRSRPAVCTGATVPTAAHVRSSSSARSPRPCRLRQSTAACSWSIVVTSAPITNIVRFLTTTHAHAHRPGAWTGRASRTV
eukprot:scaffold117612_cov39-Tisochrysis_lutea.AAC.1